MPTTEIVLIPFACGALFFAFLFGFLALLRYLQYRETVALAEKGLIKPINGRTEARNEGQGALRWGIVIASLGLALTLGLWPLGIFTDYWLGIGPWMLGGFIPLFFGLGLVLIYVLTREKEKDGGNGGESGGTSA